MPWLTLSGSNYPCFERISMVLRAIEVRLYFLFGLIRKVTKQFLRKLLSLKSHLSPFRRGNYVSSFMLSGLFYFNSLDRSISYIRGVCLVFIIITFCRNFWAWCKQCRPWSDAAAASDLGIHCLPMSLLWDARLKWVKIVLPPVRKGVCSKGKASYLLHSFKNSLFSRRGSAVQESK